MYDTTRQKAECEDLQSEIATLQKDSERLKAEIAEWILRRKVEAGAIAASGLEQLDKAQHACRVVQQAVDEVRKATVLLAEAARIPQIAKMVCEMHGDKSDKQLLRDLENADAVSKSAVIFLIQVKDLILDADLKLKSTGWLSDRPPKIPEADQLQNELEKAGVNEVQQENMASVSKVVDDVTLKAKSVITEVTEVTEVTEEQCPSKRANSLQNVEETLDSIRNQKKNIKTKMPQGRTSPHTNDDQKADRHMIDEAELEDLTRKAEELSKKIGPFSSGNSMLSMLSEDSAEKYLKATLRNTPVEDAMPDHIGVSANF